MILDNGLKIMSIDATDLFKVDAKTNEVVPSGLSSYYDYKDESTGETLHLRNSRMFKMKLNNSMALDELGRLIADRRMTKTATFKVRRKLATDQVVYVTFKYASFRSTLEDDKDDKGKVNKYKVKGWTKETIRNKVYDDENFSFKIDDIEYVRWCRSGSASRTGKCFFINKELAHAMELFTDCGINPKKRKINLASFEAYRALLLSDKIGNLDIRPENILLIKDAKSVFKDKVMYVGLDTDNKLFTEKKDMTIENKIWDGQSLIDKSLMGDYQDKGMLLLRHKFFKSCCFNSNIQQWFKDNHITEISQLNGLTTAKKIEDIKFITTPSSIKYCKFGDAENWFFDWLEQISKKNIPFGIVKYEKPTKYFSGKLVRTHYQILNTLQITKEKIQELLKPTLEYIELLRNNPLAMYHYCEATSDDEDSDLMMNVKADVIYRMMKLNESFKDTALYKVLAKKVIESIRADIKCGRILVNGNYSTVLGNPIEMLQESIGEYKPETTIIGKGNIVSTAFPKKKLLACRSPHITMGNIYLPQNTENQMVTTYINLTDNIMVINSVGENVLQRANSMDFDSDQMMIVDNDIMIEAAEKNYDKFLVPTTDIEPVTKEDEYTAKNLAKLDYDSSENLIGEIVNLSQVLNSKLWDEMNKDEQDKSDQSYIDKLYMDVCQLSIMSGLEIDKAKKTLPVDNKKELKEIRERYKEECKITKNGKTVVVKKILYPNFFKELGKKGNYDSKKIYVNYATTLDMIGQEIAYKTMTIEGEEKALHKILRKPDIKSRDVNKDTIAKVLELCEERANEDKKLGAEKTSLGKTEYNRMRKQTIENFLEDLAECKFNQATLYTLLTDKDAEKYVEYILQGLLELKCPALKKLVKTDSKTPTLVEDAAGDIEIYGIKHKEMEVA
jgi:hypothetical protein